MTDDWCHLPNPVKGTCQSMCPDAETTLREREGLLHPFEMLDGTERRKRPKADKQKIVKSYSRPAAGRHDPVATELRPADVLLKTVSYLVKSIVPKNGVSWSQVYDFVFDRFRAVRQDMVIQQITGEQSIHILEPMVLFHIYAGYRLSTEPISVYDPKINEQHTQECLKRLLTLYEHSNSKTETKYIAIYLLFNLGNTEALNYAINLPKETRQSKPIQLALAINRAYNEGNYVRFFRLVHRLTGYPVCAVHRKFAHIQRKALEKMSTAYNNKALKYPVKKLTVLLSLNCEKEAEELCKNCGLNVTSGMVTFQKPNYRCPERVDHLHYDFIREKLGKGDELG